MGDEEKRRILLLNPCSGEPAPIYYGPPYGLSLIAAYLEEKGTTPVCLDFERHTEESMQREVSDIVPGFMVVGISIQSSNRGVCYRLMKLIREKNRDAAIVLGGPFASQMYELLLENHPADYCVVGEGHRTFHELVNAIEDDGDVSCIEGVAYLSDGKVRYTGGRKEESDLDNLPIPGFHLFDVKSNLGKGLKDYYVHKKKRCLVLPDALMLLSSIGCVYSCNFCPMSGVKGMKYREHSPKRFVDIVEHFIRMYGQRNFVFGDNFFTLNRKRTAEICNEIISRGLGISWICMTRTDHVDQELLKLMAKAGCQEISFGVESCSPRVQESIGKRLDLGSVKEAFEGCDAAGIKSVLMLMVGNTGDTKSTILETMAGVREFEPDEIQVKRTKVYPGTRLYDIAKQEGLVRDEDYLVPESPGVVFTAENSIEEINGMKGMVGLRNTYLEIGKSCNSNCTNCRYEGDDLSTGEVVSRLDQVQKRSDEVTLTGGEVAIRKDIFRLIDYAKGLKLVKVNMRSNGRIFKYLDFTRKVLSHNVDNIIVRMETIDPGKSRVMTKVGSALDEAIEGIRNICRCDAERLTVEVNVNQENLDETEDILRVLHESGVRRVNLLFSALDASKGRIKDLTGHAGRIFKEGRIQFMNIPYCYLAKPSLAGDIYHPFDESLKSTGEVVNLGKIRRQMRYKIAECKGCIHEGLCEGFWR